MLTNVSGANWTEEKLGVEPLTLNLAALILGFIGTLLIGNMLI